MEGWSGRCAGSTNGPNEKVILWGKPKPPLPPAQYAVVKLLLEAYSTNERLSKTQLENRAKDQRGNSIEDPVGSGTTVQEGQGLEASHRHGEDSRAWLSTERPTWRAHDDPPNRPQRRVTHPRLPTHKSEKVTHQTAHNAV